MRFRRRAVVAAADHPMSQSDAERELQRLIVRLERFTDFLLLDSATPTSDGGPDVATQQ